MRVKLSWIILVAMFLLTHIAVADLQITVDPHKGWGDAPTSNIKRLCENIVLHFQEQLRDEYKLNGELTIVYNSGGPIAFYRSAFNGGPNEYRIGLEVTDTYWAQFSYQFGHEFGHLLHNFEETTGNNPNQWFQEALCELANLWVIRRMSKTWAYRAPYNNWVDYRHALADYANNWMMSRPEVQYNNTGAKWLSEWENRLRENFGGHDYARVAQLSYKFLPIFEDNPKGWNAIRQLPTSHAKMVDYMRIWYNDVDIEDKEIVKAIAEIMGIPVTGYVMAQTDDIDADIDNNGYVDLSDVLIVRGAINNTTSYDTDVNNDGITNEIDVLLVKAKAVEAIVAASPPAVMRKRIGLRDKRKFTTWGALKQSKY